MIETRANTAWPALRIRENEGWMFRAAGGYTRRSNCIIPPWNRPPNDLRRALENALYRCRAENFSPTIKIVSFLPYRNELLAVSGELRAREHGASSVMVAPLSAHRSASDFGSFVDHPSPAWMDTFARWSEIPPAELGGMRGILGRIPAPRAFFTGRVGDGPAALGIGVVTGKSLGLFDFVVDPARRRGGHGAALLTEILRWGAGQGARRAYLQVLRANTPALRLYERFGFRPAYEYAYYSIDD